MDLNLGDEDKYPELSQRIRNVNQFGREYLSSTSVVTILPTGIVPKDSDIIVKVIKRTEEGYKLNNGREDLFMSSLSTFAEEGDIAKLRSVVRFIDQGKMRFVVPNNFTSLISLREWTLDAQKFIKNYDSHMDLEDEGKIYTTLQQLSSMPISK